VKASAPPSATMRFNPPPNWPSPPPGWTVPPGWRPDPAWGAPPLGWQLWLPDTTPAVAPPELAPGVGPTGSTTPAQFRAEYQQDRPVWMHAGTLEAALLEGHENLEVVGESYRQEHLWRVVGGRHRPEVEVRKDVYAMLLAEDDNPHDPNAVSIWIDGLMVGYLSRDQARALRPGLLAVQEREGKPIALEGVIVGGGMRDDGPGRLGVFLRYDPEDFGLADSSKVVDADVRPRAALPATTFSDPFECKWGSFCTFCKDPIPEGSLMIGLLGGGRAFVGPRTKFRGFCHPECVPSPEAMERLDFTRMTSVARARMKDKFGAKIYLHRTHGTFRVVIADGSVEPGSDNPETAPTLEALLKRTKWWGFKDA
jgi:hypothetical protein